MLELQTFTLRFHH